MSVSLKNKTVKGVGWSFADNIASSGITFLVGLVLARLLSPEEFGVLGMIAIFIAVSNSIVDSGFSNALIRKIDATDVDYNTVFYFNLLVGSFFYILLFLFSPAIGSFFNEPQLVSITRIMGTVLVINALSIIHRTILIKNIDFKTQTKISLISSISSGIVGIVMALYNFGVWSLVGQQLSRQLLNTVFLWIYSQWRPILIFSRESFKELFGFGSKLLLSGLIDTIYRNIYYLIIGRYYSASQLGQYTRSEQFNSIFSSNLTSIVQKVSYPVLSEIQNDKERLLDAYRKIIKTTMLVTFAFMLGLAAVAQPLVLTLIGEKWLPCVSYLQIICFAGMLYPLHAINLNILQVIGRSDLLLRLEILKKIIAIIPIIIGVFYGIEYMLWGGVCVSFIAFFLNAHYSSPLINYSSIDQLKDIFPTFVISAVVALVMWGLTVLSLPSVIVLLLQCTIGVVLAIIIYEKLNLLEYIEFKQIVISFVKRK